MTAANTERRGSTRSATVDEHGVHTVRIRPGHSAAIVNVSSSGALLETHRRLLPGGVIDLQLVVSEQTTIVRAHVVRCVVSRVGAASIAYRGAVRFENHVTTLRLRHSGRYADYPESGRARVAATRAG